MRVLFITLMINHIVISIDHVKLFLTGRYIDVLVIYYVLFAMPMLILTVVGALLFVYKKQWRYAIVHGGMIVLLLVVCGVANNSVN